MKQRLYFGTKQILAAPMNRLDYNNYRGWPLPDDEDGGDAGYLVEYVDGGQSNHADHGGYISWSPADVFNKAYQSADQMDFSHALAALKAEYCVARRGWNGVDMFVVLLPPLYLPPFNTQGTNRKVNYPTAKWIGEDAPLDCQPYFSLYTASKKWQPGWVPSTADCLANDWHIVN